MDRTKIFTRLMFAGILAGAACKDSSSGGLDLTDPTSTGGAVASINVLLPSATIATGSTVQAQAQLVDANARIISGETVTWSTDDSTIATVSSSGLVRGVRSGQVHVLAWAKGKTGKSAPLGVGGTPTPTSTASVASVITTLNSAALSVGQATQANAVLKDSVGNVLTGRTVTWSSSNTAVATVSASGYVTATGSGSASLIATSGGKSGSASLSVTAATAAPVASVSVTLSSGSVQAGATAQATAAMKDASGNVLSGRAVSWSSSNPSVASVSTSGVVTGVAAGSASITATSEGKTGSASVSVTAPPPPPTSSNGSAEPAGMTMITERPFSAATEDGWSVSASTPSAFSIVQDPTAPKSPNGVGRVTYPTGWAGGDSPALVERELGQTATTMYVSLWVKMSSNWSGNPSGVNKIAHFWVDGINRALAYASGAGTDALHPYLALQQLYSPYYDGVSETATSVMLQPNVQDVPLVRGQWYHWEIILTSNTNGGANGAADWYVNGTHVGHYTGIPYVGAGRPRTWDVIKIDPTWGGMGGNVPATQTMDFDHVYISGKP